MAILAECAAEMPTWYSRLKMASEWGNPPWALFGGHPWLWEMRWRLTRQIEAEANRDRNQ